MKLLSALISITLFSSSIHLILSPNYYFLNQSVTCWIANQANDPPASSDGGSRFSEPHNKNNSEDNSDTILTL